MDQFGEGQAVMPPDENQLVKQLSIPLYQAKGWMRLLGVLSIISGVFQAITIWGIIICWLPIWMGVLMFKAAGAVEVAQLSGDRLHLTAGLNHLKTFFTIQGIILLIMLVLAGIGLLVAGGSILALLSQFEY